MDYSHLNQKDKDIVKTIFALKKSTKQAKIPFSPLQKEAQDSKIKSSGRIFSQEIKLNAGHPISIENQINTDQDQDDFDML